MDEDVMWQRIKDLKQGGGESPAVCAVPPVGLACPSGTALVGDHPARDALAAAAVIRC